MSNIEKTITDFLLHCRVEKNLSIHTLKAYRLDLNQFFQYLSTQGGALDIEKIDKHILRDFLQELIAKNKIKTVKRKIATLKALFNYLEFDDKITVNPFRKMRIQIKEPLHLPLILALNEVKALLLSAYNEKQSCSGRTSYSYKSIVRDIAVLELLFATGTRVSELCNLKKTDVDIHQNYIKVNGKGSRERVIQVCSAEIIAILKEYIDLFLLTNGLDLGRVLNPLNITRCRTISRSYNKTTRRVASPHWFLYMVDNIVLYFADMFFCYLKPNVDVFFFKVDKILIISFLPEFKHFIKKFANFNF